MGKNVRKIVDANRDEKDEEKRKELQLDDKGISSLTDIDNNLSTLSHLTRLILAHNRLTKITQGNLRDPCIGIRKWLLHFFEITSLISFRDFRVEVRMPVLERSII